MKKYFLFFCSSRDFHAIDWLRSFEKNFPFYKYVIIGDSISAEGEVNLSNENDTLDSLIIIDKFLFSSKTKFANIWRNIIKSIIIPFQLYIIYTKVKKKYPDAIIFANGAYFIFLLSLLNIKFIANPIGSEVLIRPFKSLLYKKILIFSLKKAALISVDSVSMKNVLKKSFNINSVIIQNGVKTPEIMTFLKKTSKYNNERSLYTSIRALDSLYNIHKLIEARNISNYPNISIDFIYPFYDLLYMNKCKKCMNVYDKNIGRLFGDAYYEQLAKSKIVFSLPSSDSSPKSVYEALFFGCILVVTNLEFLEMIPYSMKSRIITVDLSNPDWFNLAVEKSEILLKKEIKFDELAIKYFDRDENVKKLHEFIINVYEGSPLT